MGKVGKARANARVGTFDSERSFQKALVKHLRWTFDSWVFWTYFPAGGGGVQRGRILQAMGLRPGVPDILIIHGGRAHWLELKSATGKVSPEQRETQAVLDRAGSYVATVRTLADAFKAIDHWGIPTRTKPAEGGPSWINRKIDMREEPTP